jgi:hypothetical protein
MNRVSSIAIINDVRTQCAGPVPTYLGMESKPQHGTIHDPVEHAKKSYLPQDEAVRGCRRGQAQSEERRAKIVMGSGRIPKAGGKSHKQNEPGRNKSVSISFRRSPTSNIRATRAGARHIVPELRFGKRAGLTFRSSP